MKKSKLYILISTVILFSVLTEQSNAQCDIVDWEALQALYVSTDGPNWTNNFGWDLVDPAINATPPAGCDLSTMLGVNIDGSGRVSYIALTNRGLNGPIPPEIGDLTNLTSLILLYNQLSGDIPPEIGSLTNLGTLNLKVNQLTGSIPAELGNLTNLFLLQLDNNQLSGCYDSNLTSLCNFTNAEISDGNNFDAPWDDFCNQGDGLCPFNCPTNVQAEVESGDVYLDDACYGVILTSPGGICYRLKVQDDGTFISELVACP